MGLQLYITKAECAALPYCVLPRLRELDSIENTLWDSPALGAPGAGGANDASCAVDAPNMLTKTKLSDTQERCINDV